MNKITRFEDLSNDLFLDIFDYFHAFDLFMAFSSLNNRISFTLSLPQLHIVISKLHCQSQMKFLCSHLTTHIDQVISISIQDQLRDFSSVICFLFEQYQFKNLRSCIFYSICSSSKFHDVIKKLKTLNKLVSFRILQSKVAPLSDFIKQELSKTILTHKSPAFRSISLMFSYNYPSFINNIVINSTITSLRLRFVGSIVTCSIYSLLPILRYFRAIRILSLSISNKFNSNNQQISMPILPSIYEINPPKSFTIKTFEFNLETLCDFHSLDFILHCMPNLHQFIISITCPSSVSVQWAHLFNGNQWKQLLINTTPNLNKFDISLHKFGFNLVLDTDTILKSFDFFVQKYDNWHLAIHQSLHSSTNKLQMISLYGHKHPKKSRYFHSIHPSMVLGTVNVHSTRMTNDQDHLFYSHYRRAHINIQVFNTLQSTSLFKNLHHLSIEIDSSMLTFWQDLRSLFNFPCNISRLTQKQHAMALKNLIDLTNITQLEIQPKDEILELYFIQEILLSTSKLTRLKVGNSLIFSSILYNNLSLIPIFHQLQSLYLLSEHNYFPLRYVSKILKRFPSLIHLELEIYSLDKSMSLIDMLFDGLSNLIHLKIHFHKNNFLGDGIILIDHLTKKRPQTSRNHDDISIKTTQNIIDIYLCSCLICAKEKFII